MLERGRSLARCAEGGLDGSCGVRSEVRAYVFPPVQLFQAVWNVISHGDLDRVVSSQIVLGGD